MAIAPAPPSLSLALATCVELQMSDLRFLEITDKTRRWFLYPGVLLYPFSNIFAPYGAGIREASKPWMSPWLSTFITSIKKETTSPLLDGQSAACAGSLRAANFLSLPHNCLTAVGFNWQSIFRNGPFRFRGWVPKLWLLPHGRWGDLTSPSWFSSHLPSFCVLWS